MARNRQAPVFFLLGSGFAVILVMLSLASTQNQVKTETDKKISVYKTMIKREEKLLKLTQQQIRSLNNTLPKLSTEATELRKQLKEAPEFKADLNLEGAATEPLEQTEASKEQLNNRKAKKGELNKAVEAIRIEYEAAKSRVKQSKAHAKKLSDQAAALKSQIKQYQALLKAQQAAQKPTNLEGPAKPKLPERPKPQSNGLEGPRNQLPEYDPIFKFGLDTVPANFNKILWSDASQKLLHCLESGQRRVDYLKKQQVFNFYYQKQEKDAYLSLGRGFESIQAILGEANSIEVISHPLIVANLAERTLKVAEQPLSADQIAALNRFGLQAMADLKKEQQRCAKSKCPEMERILSYGMIKHQFQVDLHKTLTDSQRHILFINSEIRPQLNAFSPFSVLILSQKLVWDYSREKLQLKAQKALYQMAGQQPPKEIPEAVTKALNTWIAQYPTKQVSLGQLSELDRRYLSFTRVQALINAQVHALKTLAHECKDVEKAQQRLHSCVRLTILSHVELKKRR